MNRFYEQSKLIQWTISIVMLCIAILILYGWFIAMQASIWSIALVFLITPAWQFLATPFMKLTKTYVYISPMLLIYAPSEKRYDLHNGTSFDYLFQYNSSYSHYKWQKMLLYYYMRGFLEIIRRIEMDELPETVEVRGSSYFFSPQTASRFSFTLSDTSIAEKFNILINYLDLLWMYSLAKGKLTFPRLGDIKTASITGKDLVIQKDKIQKYADYLQR